MKLIIQIPCLNEAETLPMTLAALPRQIDGINEIEWLVIDDGSTDETVAVARACGVRHIVRHTHNMGLARAFMTGIEMSIKLGADIIVNTDADNQYDASCIEDLVRPVLAGTHQIVIGARPIDTILHFSFLKRVLQKLGSLAVRIASKTDVPDAPSGFRAISRDAAMRTYVYSDYTYTLETIIQAGRSNIPITSVPVRVNGEFRPSRLVKSIFGYVLRSMFTIIRVLVLYRPFAVLGKASLAFLALALFLSLRFMYFYWSGDGDGHVQSLQLAVIAFTMSVTLGTGAFICEMIGANRQLLEELRYRQLKTAEDNSESLFGSLYTAEEDHPAGDPRGSENDVPTEIVPPQVASRKAR